MAPAPSARFSNEIVSFSGKTSSGKNATSELSPRVLQRRHSVYEYPTSEGRVLRRVASLTLDRNKKKRSFRNTCQKTDRRKQFAGEERVALGRNSIMSQLQLCSLGGKKNSNRTFALKSGELVRRGAPC